MKTNQIIKLSVTAMFAALLCVLAPVSIPLSTMVPVSLATFVIYLLSSILEPKYACLSVVIYILLGTFGVPVFAGWTGGAQIIIGATGGYIIGYVPLAFCTSLWGSKFKNQYLLPFGMIIGTVVLYVLGTAWFMYQTKNPLGGALTACVIPFLPGDAAKIVLSSAVAVILKKRVPQLKVISNS